MANTIVQTYLTQLLLAKETTFQTATTVGVSIAAKNPKATEIFASVLDQGYRGHAAQDYAYYQGEGHSEIDLPDMQFYPADSGHFLMAVLGTDTATTSASSTSHAITLLDGMPPSYTLSDYNGIDTRQYAGLYFSEVNFKWLTPGRFTASAKAAGMFATTTSKPAFPAYDSASVYIPWEMASTVSSLNTHIINMELALKRKVDPIWGMTNSQQPNLASVGPLEATGKIDFAVADNTEFNYYRNNTQPTATFLFTGASTVNTMQFHFQTLAFETPTVTDRTKDYLVVTSSFRGIWNSTDSGPLKATITNARTASY